MDVRQVHMLKAHSGALYALAKGRTVGTLFTAGADKVVAEWDLSTGTVNPFAIRMPSTVYSMLNINRALLAIGTAQGGIHVVDLHTKKEIRHLKFHTKGIYHLQHNQERGHVYAACGDGSISVWNVNDWSLLWHMQLSEKKVRRTATSADGGLLSAASGDGRLFVFSTDNYKLAYSVEAHSSSCNAAAFMKNGDVLTGGKDAYLNKWKLGQAIESVQRIPAHNFAIYDIVLNEFSGWIATASRDKTIKLWDLDLALKPLRIDRKTHLGHIHSVNGLMYLEEEDLLVSCSDDRSAMVWKVRN